MLNVETMMMPIQTNIREITTNNVEDIKHRKVKTEMATCKTEVITELEDQMHQDLQCIAEEVITE
jgi:hypothetical protein